MSRVNTEQRQHETPTRRKYVVEPKQRLNFAWFLDIEKIMYHRPVLLLTIVNVFSNVLYSFSSDVPKCETGFKNCCPNYKWNVESQRCERCLPGYGGTNCSIMCPYPYYGERCQEECDCVRDLCDVSVGCEDVPTDKTRSSIISTVNEDGIVWLKELSTYKPVSINTLCGNDVPKCETGFKNCCPDYKWNVESQRCEKCLPGYLGINCSIMCLYPYYGEECQEECDCERELCDVSVGCKDVTTDKTRSSIINTVNEDGIVWLKELSTYKPVSIDTLCGIGIVLNRVTFLCSLSMYILFPLLKYLS
ncbi:scavenger receptor class F member 2-like isoform X2 [Ostrea edulis]|uniref:scavenger receptor class F member 2-like isoform X2 n=1 Tax=Ostrea edulis TaxID=37623 RepID=UPI0024AFBF50|nr:scavenger receptor class F member 2-like isoform X2 [Ostrea edulis]XP_056013949.1 scavenger receptor class F member 2-like isoform X2 [Ostrea edulis]XP_056013950.1 scavenger receptor class F member 2-like isoform X2 [Ostrea edulis]